MAKAIPASRLDRIKATKKRKSEDTAFELSQCKLDAACKAKWRTWLLKVPKHVKLIRAIWSAPNKKEIAMAHYYGLRRTGLTQEECAVIVAQSILRPGTLDPIHPKVITRSPTSRRCGRCSRTCTSSSARR